MIYLLLDNPGDKNRISFISEQAVREMREVYSPRCKRLMVGWLKGCLKVLRQSHRDDTIVCWYDFQAVLCYWISKLSFKRRKIVCINILLKDKASAKNKAVAWLYEKALRDKNFVASVTSVEYGRHLQERLAVAKPFFLLHDVYHGSYKYEGGSVNVLPNTVFCGGRNGRNWRFMIEVAKAMPDVEFHLVMPEAIYHEFGHDLPGNVVVKYDLTTDDFMREMCSCEIVALPLDTEAPAGLIVLFQAAANMKYIITTDTMTTREYLSDGRGCLLSNDVAAWEKIIEEKLGNGQENNKASEKLLRFLETECSEKKFVDGVKRMIDNLR